METTGCGTAIVTPFRADGSIDEQALKALVNWQIDAGIDFLVACGSTGEAATLDEDEWLHAVCIVAEAAAGRVPVWAGCTHNSTRTLLRHAGLLKQIRGIDAVLSANPYYNKPSQEGQFQHFLALARAVDPLPVALYNVPGRTAVNLDPETVVRLASCPRSPNWSTRCRAGSRSSPATTTWRWRPSASARMASSAWPPTRSRPKPAA
jgi:4-hydroxy-tetrahydrodipicolinate synthase